MVISPDSEFFDYLSGSNGLDPTPRAAPGVAPPASN
jgi:hypothetical protein